MRQFQIGKNEAGQRLDKFLHKYLPNAQNGFLYKMLRKKNITLNGKKAEGKEMLSEGDELSFFFSEETFSKFSGEKPLADESTLKAENKYQKAYKTFPPVSILYEDSHVLILNKPTGILTQKAEKASLSLNEWMIGYLLHTGQFTEEELKTFRPSVCNRLDRNTSGLVLCGKSLAGSQELGRLIQERDVRKFYRTFVKGEIKEGTSMTGYLQKEERTNTVLLSLEKKEEGSSLVETSYEPLQLLSDRTYLEVELITGKTHQIRAHLAATGHPLLGDYKYGLNSWNDKYRKKYGISHQILHAYRMEFPALKGPLQALSGRTVTAPLPEIFLSLLED